MVMICLMMELRAIELLLWKKILLDATLGYKAFDNVDGIEVAWSQVNIEDVLESPQYLDLLYSEANLLKSLNHGNILKCYHSWVDDSNKTINMITELLVSGSLRRYQDKYKIVGMIAIKNWARQILQGLCYLHSHNPPIVHRDLKCDNIFINGHSGEVKIADLGLATDLSQPTAQKVLGTLEFMAPELYEGEYNELADIYSFGMCILEMYTFEYPYKECRNPLQIYKKVTSGIKPAALSKVTDPQLKQFIEKCLVPLSMRLSASELLKDPFLAIDNMEINHVQQLPNQPMETDQNVRDVLLGPCLEVIEQTPQTSTIDLVRKNKSTEFKLKGERNTSNRTILLDLGIFEANGHVRNIHFPFFFESDTAISVAEEMASSLDLNSEDTSVIAELLHTMSIRLAPDGSVSHQQLSTFADCSDDHSHVVSSGAPSLRCHSDEEPVNSSVLYDQEKHEPIMPVISPEDEIAEYLQPDYTIFDGYFEGSTLGRSNSEANGEGSLNMNKDGFDNSMISTVSFVYPYGGDEAKNFDLSSNISPYLDDNGQRHDLQSEIETINTEYDKCILELGKIREDAIESTKRRWLTRNTMTV